MTATETREPQTESPRFDATVEDELRSHAIASLKRKRKFWEDAAAYVAINGVLWLIWALGDRSVDGLMPWPAWVSVIWGFLLLVDGVRAFSRWPRSGPIGEAEIEREIRRQRSR